MNLLAINFDRLPFVPCRVYLTQPDMLVCIHRHFIEQEVFVLYTGRATLVTDDGTGVQHTNMVPHQPYYIPAGVWHGLIDVFPQSVILAISSTLYTDDRSDYDSAYLSQRR